MQTQTQSSGFVTAVVSVMQALLTALFQTTCVKPFRNGHLTLYIIIKYKNKPEVSFSNFTVFFISSIFVKPDQIDLPACDKT